MIIRRNMSHQPQSLVSILPEIGKAMKFRPKKFGLMTFYAMTFFPVRFRNTIVVALLCVAPQLAAFPARAQDDHYACMNDAMTICGQYIPDRERVAHCLMANRTRVSPACRTALKRFR